MPFRKRDQPIGPQSFFCVMCGAKIPEERIRRKAVTCSPEHANDFKNAKRRLRDTERCRLCNRPSTAAERADFTRWRQERRAEETQRRREEKKKAAAKDKEEPEAATPLEQYLGTVAV